MQHTCLGISRLHPSVRSITTNCPETYIVGLPGCNIVLLREDETSHRFYRRSSAEKT